MTLEPQTAGRVRCRPIVEGDLEAIADLLARGFPRSTREYWAQGFARWRKLPVVEGVPHYGHILDNGFGPVGVILLISSLRGDRIISNLSSWYVEPAWRAHSVLLVKATTRLKNVTYLNASPAPHTWKMLKAQAFEFYNLGRSAVFALPGRGKVSSAIPDDLPEARLLHDHRDMGMVSLVVEKDGRLSPFVFKPRRLDKPPVKVMDVMFCRDPEDFRRCAPALARHFLPQGVLGFLIDGKVPSSFPILARYVQGKEPRHYKGPRPPVLGDLAYTEIVVFG